MHQTQIRCSAADVMQAPHDAHVIWGGREDRQNEADVEKEGRGRGKRNENKSCCDANVSNAKIDAEERQLKCEIYTYM